MFLLTDYRLHGCLSPLSDWGYLVGFENHSKKEKVCFRQRQSISLLCSLPLSAFPLLFFNQPNDLGWEIASSLRPAPSWLRSFVSNVAFHSVWPHPSALTSIPTVHVHPSTLFECFRASSSWRWRALVFAEKGDSDSTSVGKSDDLLGVDETPAAV